MPSAALLLAPQQYSAPDVVTAQLGVRLRELFERIEREALIALPQRDQSHRAGAHDARPLMVPDTYGIVISRVSVGRSGSVTPSV